MNINETVYVKLTERGIAILEDDWVAKGYAGRLGMFQVPKTDENGYTRYQLWSLMQDFGPHIYMGVRVPFETEIYTESEYKERFG